jgi:hypothetical protein
VFTSTLYGVVLAHQLSSGFIYVGFNNGYLENQKALLFTSTLYGVVLAHQLSSGFIYVGFNNGYLENQKALQLWMCAFDMDIC